MKNALPNQGSALILAITVAVILAGLGATTLLVLQDRYRLVHQTASWHEALLAAEGGVDLATAELRKTLFEPAEAWNGWSRTGTATLGDSGSSGGAIDPTEGTVYHTSTVMLRNGEGTGSGSGTVTNPYLRDASDRRLATWTEVAVDAPVQLRDASGEQWYRVRALGVAELPGPAIVAGEKEDVRFRKLEFFTNRRKHERLQRPRATRLIEAIIKPVGAFRTALLGTSSINLNNSNIVVDSYDSRDTSKSTNGLYDPLKRQNNADIATNGTLIDAGNAHIYGDASTNGGTVLGASNVTGEIRNDFYQEIFVVTKPTVTPDIDTPTQINGDTIIDARTGTPTQVVVSSLKLSGQHNLRIRGAADGSETFCQIVVNGDISLSGLSQIQIDPGVFVRIFVVGDADISGNGIANPNSVLNFQLYGCDRPKNADGTAAVLGQLKIAGNGGLRGAVFAPNYNVSLVGGGAADTIYGSFVGNTVTMTGVQSVHYDEALADGGLISDYKVVSWFEDVR